MAAREAASVTLADEAILELIGRLSLVPVPYLQPLSGNTSPTALYRRVARLGRRHLVEMLSGPPEGAGRRHRLLVLSNLGLAVLAWRRDLDPAGLAHVWGLHRPALLALVGELPALLYRYALLGLLARTGRQPALLRAWSSRWRWRGRSGPGQRFRGVQQAACAALAWEEADGRRLEGTYLLVADTGGLSPAVLRPQLAALARHERAAELVAPTLVIATTSERRVEAWRVLLDDLASSPRAGLLQAQVDTWSRWHARVGTTPPPGPVADAYSDSLAAAPLRPEQERQLWQSVPRPIDVRVVTNCVRDWDLAPRDRAALDIVGRHPFLPSRTLADVLGNNIGWARARHSELVRRGLARVLPPEELPLDLRGERDLLELTLAGLRMLAGYLGLSMQVAVRVHGLTGGGPMTPVGPRRALLANLAHTLGTDRTFAEMARAARTHHGRLVEWRNAAACAHGRMRPDGYGLLRLGTREHGFFLEFDRGTVRLAALRAKFAAYHRYRSSARAAREYDGFPTILVVTVGPGAEERITEAVRGAEVGQASRLPVLLTTVGLIETHVEGPLGSIWRGAHSRRLQFWPTPTGRRDGLQLGSTTGSVPA